MADVLETLWEAHLNSAAIQCSGDQLFVKHRRQLNVRFQMALHMFRCAAERENETAMQQRQLGTNCSETEGLLWY